jgi:hypothetical protein
MSAEDLCVVVAALCLGTLACGEQVGRGANEAGIDADSSSDAGVDAAEEMPVECVGIDADSMGIDFAPGCLACVATHCCTQAKVCATQEECKQIIKCEAACTAMGNAAMACAVGCIFSDGKDAGGLSSIPPDAELDNAQNQAFTLDECFARTCASVCDPGS